MAIKEKITYNIGFQIFLSFLSSFCILPFLAIVIICFRNNRIEYPGNWILLSVFSLHISWICFFYVYESKMFGIKCIILSNDYIVFKRAFSKEKKFTIYDKNLIIRQKLFLTGKKDPNARHIYPFTNHYEECIFFDYGEAHDKTLFPCIPFEYIFKGSANGVLHRVNYMIRWIKKHENCVSNSVEPDLIKTLVSMAIEYNKYGKATIGELNILYLDDKNSSNAKEKKKNTIND